MLNSIVAVEECDARVLNKRTIAGFKKIKMQRKEFIKSTCNFCLLGAAGFMLPQLIGCSDACQRTPDAGRSTVTSND